MITIFGSFNDSYNINNLGTTDDEYRNEYYINADGTHPNNKGHKILANKIVPFLQNIINN